MISQEQHSIEAILSSLESGVKNLTQIDRESSIFSRLRIYLREKLGKLFEIIVKNFNDPTQRIPLKAPFLQNLEKFINLNKLSKF